jgi:hypothetical protein
LARAFWRVTFFNYRACSVNKSNRCATKSREFVRHAPEISARQRGIAEQTSWNVVMYAQGWWNMATKVAVNQAMNLSWFTQQGLQSLKTRMQG